LGYSLVFEAQESKIGKEARSQSKGEECKTDGAFHASEREKLRKRPLKGGLREGELKGGGAA